MLALVKGQVDAVAVRDNALALMKDKAWKSICMMALSLPTTARTMSSGSLGNGSVSTEDGSRKRFPAFHQRPALQMAIPP